MFKSALLSATAALIIVGTASAQNELPQAFLTEPELIHIDEVITELPPVNTISLQVSKVTTMGRSVYTVPMWIGSTPS